MERAPETIRHQDGSRPHSTYGSGYNTSSNRGEWHTTEMEDCTWKTVIPRPPKKTPPDTTATTEVTRKVPALPGTSAMFVMLIITTKEEGSTRMIITNRRLRHDVTTTRITGNSRQQFLATTRRNEHRQIVMKAMVAATGTARSVHRPTTPTHLRPLGPSKSPTTTTAGDYSQELRELRDTTHLGE